MPIFTANVFLHEILLIVIPNILFYHDKTTFNVIVTHVECLIDQSMLF